MHSRPFLALIMTAFLISCSEIYSGSSPIKNFRVITPGEVYSGARPDSDGLRWLESLGVKTVLNLDRGMWLESSAEVERDWKAARQLDMRFVHLPLHPTRSPTIRELHWAVAILRDAGMHPAFVHADRGSDRTGIVVAAYRIKVLGWSPDRAYREMLEHGFREIGHSRWKDRAPLCRAPNHERSLDLFCRSPNGGGPERVASSWRGRSGGRTGRTSSSRAHKGVIEHQVMRSRADARRGPVRLGHCLVAPQRECPAGVGPGWLMV